MLKYNDKSYIKEIILESPKYFLPLAAFFLLISTAATNIFLILTITTTVIIFLRKRNYQIFFDEKIIKYSLLIYILLILSVFYTIGEHYEVTNLLKKYIKFLYIPIIFYYISIFKNENLIANYFIKGSCLILFLSYLKYFSVLDFQGFYAFLDNLNIATIKSKIIFDKTGVFQNYLTQGIIFSFLSFISFVFARKSGSFLLYIISVLSFINIMFLNDSRTAYILVLTLLAIILIKYLKINKFLSLIGTACICLTITLTNIGDNFYERVIRINTDIEMMANNNFDSSLGKRYLWLQSGFNNIKSKPIFGYGVGSYKSKINEYISSNNINIDSSLVVTNNPHNEFVSLSSQIGLFGLLFFIMFLISLFKYRENNFIVYGVFTTVVISSLFNSAFYDNILGIFLIIIISLSFQKVK